MKQEKVIRINNIKLKPDHTEAELLKAVKKALRLKNNCDIKSDIIKRSIDARHKPDIMYVYSVDVKKLVINNKDTDLKAFAKKTANNNIAYNEKVIYEFPYGRINNYEGAGIKEEDRPVIIGFGPAGMFAALKLSEAGLMPVVYERGDSVEERHRKVDEFWNTGKLDTQSNVQFGEGGAGTFSDGKLNTGNSSIYSRKVLEEFVKFGAPKEIMYVAKPHLGTDNLVKIVKNIREYILEKGGQIFFEEEVIDFEIKKGQIKSVITNQKRKIETDSVILAIGHSARDTFKKLNELGVKVAPKNFAVGVRIEHLQKDINIAQYGNKTKLRLGSADYKLVYHASNGRTCYTFCMCPGGKVMASNSEESSIVTNGMSNFARDGENANSALLVNISIEDFYKESPLDGMYFQEELEKKAFELGGKNYNAPIQRVEDFLENKTTTNLGKIKPTYMPGVTFANLNEILPEFVSNTLKEGLTELDQKLHGFAEHDAIMTGVETRSSSPVQITRDKETMNSINVQGLYPCGEGAGYAGGIMTAAIDGIKCAIKIIEKE